MIPTRSLRLDSQKNIQQPKRFKLIFRGSDNGFKGYDFHKNCDNQGATFVIMKSLTDTGNAGRIFGGFTDIPWTSSGGYKA